VSGSAAKLDLPAKTAQKLGNPARADGDLVGKNDLA
jgi:hypothetical protein